MIGRADIEGSKSNVAMNAWLPQASYPCGNFSDTSSFKFRRKVLADKGSSVDVLLYPTLERMGINESSLHPYYGELVNFSRDHVSVKGYLQIATMFGSAPRAKTIDIQFLVV
ncbi:senescence-associated protein [Canna indica]|uniref:Senescence-associated protein n=1 Tax=Canna indica TaxID=4628 RepID=A0AAQ3K4V1_9LILI|nr:senescence-associated protein [Canna indica]